MPPTRSQIRYRNRAYRMLSLSPLAGIFNRITTEVTNDAITLKDYPEWGAGFTWNLPA